MAEQSASGTLNVTDWKKILKGLGIAAGGAALTYVLDLLPQINFKGYELIVIPIASTLINFALKLIAGKK